MKGDTCEVVAETSVTLSPAAIGTIGHVPNELGDLADDITSQSVRVAPDFFLAAGRTYNFHMKDRKIEHTRKTLKLLKTMVFEHSRPFWMASNDNV